MRARLGRALLIAAAAAVLAAPAGAAGKRRRKPKPQQPAPAAVGDKGVAPDVTISDSFSKKFSLEKPSVDFDVPIEELLPPSAAASPKSIPGGKDVEANKILLEALGYPESRHVVRPWLPEISGAEPAKFEFSIPQKGSVKSWELNILDARGAIVNTLRGNGEVPAKLEWNLKTATGLPILVGASYAYRLLVTDRAYRRHTFLGKSFELPALQYSGLGGSRIIELSANSLFAPKGGGLSPEGEDYLYRALEILAESKATSYRLQLQDSSPSEQVQKRIQTLSKLVTREMRVEQGHVIIEAATPRSRGQVLQIVVQ